MARDFVLVDVFAPKAFGGKKLAVFVDADGLPDPLMRSIARELSFPETIFVLPPAKSEHTRRLRIFTPQIELSFASHPTLGAAAALAHWDLIHLKNGRASMRMEMGLRVVDVDVIRQEHQISSFLSFVPKVETSRDRPRSEDLAPALSLQPLDIADAWFGTLGIAICFVQVWDRAAVDRVILDATISAFYAKHPSIPPIFVFAGDCDNKGRLYARMFAPGLGMEEDPATLPACAVLVNEMARRSGLKEGCFELSVTQGVAFGRASEIFASATISRRRIVSVRVGGPSKVMGHGTITAL